MHYFLELAKKDLWCLADELKMLRLHFALDMSSGLHEIIGRTARDTDLVSRIIKAKHLHEREEYFLCEGNLFCHAVEEQNFELAKEIGADLEYFQHCFMEDSKYKGVPVRYQHLKPLLEQEL